MPHPEDNGDPYNPASASYIGERHARAEEAGMAEYNFRIAVIDLLRQIDHANAYGEHCLPVTLLAAAARVRDTMRTEPDADDLAREALKEVPPENIGYTDLW